MNHTLGILGGLGPRATAHFLSSIYSSRNLVCEQEQPRILVDSDPTFPDRTSSLLKGSSGALVDKTEQALQGLVRGGASKLLICCYTLHQVVPLLSPDTREKVFSLVDLALSGIAEKRERTLLLCTLGARTLGVFESSPYWPSARPWICFPSDGDQELVHGLIYQLKAGVQPRSVLDKLSALSENYPVDSLTLGCTDLHTLSAESEGGFLFDPLLSLVDRIHRGDWVLPTAVACRVPEVARA
ncbi:aspartate/glutamate racemase family protein [bacterium]|nr:aspartate/glutamate racemase family protein [bacterium]